MAGEAVLSSFMQVLFDKLMTTTLNELKSISNVGQDLQNLSSSLGIIKALLEDAEEKQVRDKLVEIWLKDLKKVAYDMDELLDEYEAKALRSQKKVFWYFPCSCVRNNLFHSKIAKRIRAIREGMERIAGERNILGLQVLGSMRRLEITKRPQTSSLVDCSMVFGREKDMDNIVNMLLSGENNTARSVSVLPIIGMGGLGKTTLTQLVYNDERIKYFFELRMWICVSENFDEIKLTKETLESAMSGHSSAVSGYSTATTNLNLLQIDLSNSLKGKKFLLVLDDVWNEDHEKWTLFQNALISGAKGSKIIITTQNENVGRVMCGLPPYRLQRLTDTVCWQLFKSYAFPDGESCGYSNLEEIGKEIVKKLKGLPLVARVIGSLLHSKLDEEDWKSILKSEIWELPSGKDKILPALRLSYRHLPPHLKQCFAFCSVFHKDYVFEKGKLVQIWMALGFIQQQGKKRIEDIGSDYFDELVCRSFFEPHKGNYIMHDAMHDLAQSIFVDECLRLEGRVSHRNTQSILHMSFSCKNSELTKLDSFCDYARLRTLLLLRGYKSKVNQVPSDIFLRLRHLRVLDLHRRDIIELPESIGNLSQLRYLGLSGTGIKALPSSIGSLYSLQTLKLKHCNDLNRLPKTVINLVNLCHLEASTELVSDVPNIGKLTYLQELEEFVVRKDRRYRIRELKGMAHLRGDLRIRNIENVANQKEASEARLEDKEHIHVLELQWSSDNRHINLREKCYDEEVLDGLKPHIDLKEITVKGYAGFKFPSWLGSSLFSNLQTIHLSECRRCVHLPPLGQLPSLRYLDIASFGLKRIGHDFEGNGEVQGFSSLIELVIADMPELEEWLSRDQKSYTYLTDIEIVDCPKLKELPCLPPNLRKLRISETGIHALPKITVPESLMSSLHISACPNLSSLQDSILAQKMQGLMELRIIDCEELELLPDDGFRQLVSLKILHIYNCPRFRSLPPGCGPILPNSVEDLQVSSCSNLIHLMLPELRNLPCLKYLKISACSGMESFPEGLPRSLEFLGIMDCTTLQSLPPLLKELRSLETLTISNCPKIQLLAEDFLPRTLQELYIKGCKLLTKGLEQHGKFPSKIAHISYVEIDNEVEQRVSSVKQRRRRR